MSPGPAYASQSRIVQADGVEARSGTKHWWARRHPSALPRWRIKSATGLSGHEMTETLRPRATGDPFAKPLRPRSPGRRLPTMPALLALLSLELARKAGPFPRTWRRNRNRWRSCDRYPAVVRFHSCLRNRIDSSRMEQGAWRACLSLEVSLRRKSLLCTTTETSEWRQSAQSAGTMAVAFGPENGSS